MSPYRTSARVEAPRPPAKRPWWRKLALWWAVHQEPPLAWRAAFRRRDQRRMDACEAEMFTYWDLYSRPLCRLGLERYHAQEKEALLRKLEATKEKLRAYRHIGGPTFIGAHVEAAGGLELTTYDLTEEAKASLTIGGKTNVPL